MSDRQNVEKQIAWLTEAIEESEASGDKTRLQLMHQRRDRYQEALDAMDSPGESSGCASKMFLVNKDQSIMVRFPHHASLVEILDPDYEPTQPLQNWLSDNGVTLDDLRVNARPLAIRDIADRLHDVWRKQLGPVSQSVYSPALGGDKLWSEFADSFFWLDDQVEPLMATYKIEKADIDEFMDANQLLYPRSSD